MIRRVRVGTALATLLLAILVAGCGTAESTGQPDGCPADLAEVAETDLDSDPGDETNVYAPSWSPDGTRIAFSTGTDLFVITLADCAIDHVRPEQGGLKVDWPDWSPDGTSFAFVGHSETAAEGVFVMRSDGSGVRALAEGSVLFPAWSPDGGTIAFIDERIDEAAGTEDRNVWLVNADGTSPRRVTTGPWHGSVDWSPDGEWLVADAASAVVRVRPDGSERTIVIAGDQPSPDWSPDGETLVVQGPRFAPSSGGAPEPVEFVEGGAFEPAWSPDGEWIAFTDGLGPQDLWVARPDGDDVRQLTRVRGN
jgi:Tol biopolymer transport system component